jgi:hypothetical protein
MLPRNTLFTTITSKPHMVWGSLVSYPLSAVPIWSVTDGTRGVSSTFRDHHIFPPQGAQLRHSLDPIEMRRPAGPLTGLGPSRYDLGIDGHLMKYREQRHGGEFVEQVIRHLPGYALPGMRV